MATIHVVLCGGFGKRLWPISRAQYPKPFIPLQNDETLFNLTLNRNTKHCDKRMIVTNVAHAALAQGACYNCDSGKQRETLFLLEGIAKNTATSVTLAALAADPEDILWVTPADHWIADNQRYSDELSYAIDIAQDNALLTIGITPDSPNTQYGYIQRGKPYKQQQDIHCYKVEKFHEKPNKKTAQHYLTSGQYFWNSGMFCFKAGVFLNELQQHAPQLLKGAKSLHQHVSKKENCWQYTADKMQALQAVSIDVAVMEKSQNLMMLASKIDWRDLGQFEQLQHLTETDQYGNSKGQNIYVQDAQNNYIYSQDRYVAAVGVSELIIADTPDALLVSKRGCSAGIQTLVTKKSEKNPELFNESPVEKRPWGSFRVIKNESSIKVKEITVQPGKRLSLQKHQHRKEHWVVIAGDATVQVEQQTQQLSVGQSIDIPLGAIHRLSNQGSAPVKIIEVQFGDYLGEDDIERLEDDYKRTISD
ncbi:MAG: mannose-1-phosphate guanylyltransferase/mannose-6-phosphate isomerase [bacterium]